MLQAARQPGQRTQLGRREDPVSGEVSVVSAEGEMCCRMMEPTWPASAPSLRTQVIFHLVSCGEHIEI